MAFDRTVPILFIYLMSCVHHFVACLKLRSCFPSFFFFSIIPAPHIPRFIRLGLNFFSRHSIYNPTQKNMRYLSPTL